MGSTPASFAGGFAESGPFPVFLPPVIVFLSVIRASHA